jgi:hypothetical protein
VLLQNIHYLICFIPDCKTTIFSLKLTPYSVNILATWYWNISYVPRDVTNPIQCRSVYTKYYFSTNSKHCAYLRYVSNIFVRCCIYLTTYHWIKSFLKITIKGRAIYENLENKIKTLYWPVENSIPKNNDTHRCRR